jgi:hypothetical protein
MANENTTRGPLTATVGEQLAGKGHESEVRAAEARVAHVPEGPRDAGRPARRQALRFPPWAAIAVGAVAWAVVSGVARGVRRRIRRR